MALLKTKAIIDRVKAAEPAEAQGPAIDAGAYRARIIDAGQSKKSDKDIFLRLALYEMNDTECSGKCIKKISKVFRLEGDYADSEAGDFLSFAEAVRQDDKLEVLEAKDLMNNTLIVGVEALRRKDDGIFNVIARGGWWDAELNKVEFEPRDAYADMGRGRGRF